MQSQKRGYKRKCSALKFNPFNPRTAALTVLCLPVHTIQPYQGVLRQSAVQWELCISKADVVAFSRLLHAHTQMHSLSLSPAPFHLIYIATSISFFLSFFAFCCLFFAFQAISQVQNPHQGAVCTTQPLLPSRRQVASTSCS